MLNFKTAIIIKKEPTLTTLEVIIRTVMRTAYETQGNITSQCLLGEGDHFFSGAATENFPYHQAGDFLGRRVTAREREESKHKVGIRTTAIH